MLINELAKKTGVTAHTIRFYEKSGLIKGSRKDDIKSNNYFHYDDIAVEQLQLIQHARAAGFTLAETGGLMEAWYNDGVTVDQRLAILEEKLLALKQKIDDMKTMKKLIKDFKKDIEATSY